MTDCKQCEEVLINWLGDIGCPLLKDWLTKEEYEEKKILDNCPKRGLNETETTKVSVC